MCAYCDGMDAARCPRCGCRLCEKHAPAGPDGWCWACAKELKDELDIVRFKATVGAPTERRPDGSEGPSLMWVTIGGWVATLRERRVRKKVLARGQAEIETWRREVGIRTRW